jgi:hypothetical protein
MKQWEATVMQATLQVAIALSSTYPSPDDNRPGYFNSTLSTPDNSG